MVLCAVGNPGHFIYGRYDVTQMDSFEHLERWYEELKNAAESVSVVAVVGAKTDLTSEAVVPQKVILHFRL